MLIEKINDKQTRDFSIACVEQNSLKEILTGFDNDPDQSDIDQWNLTNDQYYEALYAAYLDLLEIKKIQNEDQI